MIQRVLDLEYRDSLKTTISKWKEMKIFLACLSLDLMQHHLETRPVRRNKMAEIEGLFTFGKFDVKAA